jgi:Holliday junction DNA helicase RuvA
MITYLEGVVIEKGTDFLVVLIGGIGLKIYAPIMSVEKAEPGKKFQFHTQLIVREDLLALYGFETAQELEYFNLLLGVTGIGPRLALAILSHAGVETIRRSVVQEQPDFLSRVPGVGKKTAQKILLHLQGKLTGFEEGFAEIRTTDYEVIEALTALGYSLVQAQAAVQTISKDVPDTVEEKIRAALQSLA